MGISEGGLCLAFLAPQLPSSFTGFSMYDTPQKIAALVSQDAQKQAKQIDRMGLQNSLLNARKKFLHQLASIDSRGHFFQPVKKGLEWPEWAESNK